MSAALILSGRNTSNYYYYYCTTVRPFFTQTKRCVLSVGCRLYFDFLVDLYMVHEDKETTRAEQLNGASLARPGTKKRGLQL